MEPKLAKDDWRRLHAFGWPAGSVRALMALLVFGTLWGMLVLRPQLELPQYLNDLIFIVLGHYFAVRSRAGAESEPGPPPLYLPRGSVRLLLIGGFVATAVALYQKGGLRAHSREPAVVTLLLVGGFLLGVMLRQIAAWWEGRGHRPSRLLEDARAAVSLLAAILLVLVVWDEVFPFLPRTRAGAFHELQLGLGRLGPPHVLAAIVGFYFGSRS